MNSAHKEPVQLALVPRQQGLQAKSDLRKGIAQMLCFVHPSERLFLAGIALACQQIQPPKYSESIDTPSAANLTNDKTQQQHCHDKRGDEHIQAITFQRKSNNRNSHS